MTRWIPVITLALAMLSGCHSTPEPSPVDPAARTDDPFTWTLGSQCELVNYTAVKVEGYSIVWGLPGTGSGECPPQVRDYLIQYLRRIKPQRHLEQYRGMTDEAILMDKSTAVVQVRGIVPAGAPQGEKFDLVVTALPATQTTSLQGGYLAATDLQMVGPGASGRILASRPHAVAEGPLFINPFPRADGSQSDPRRAVIFGGGKSIADRRIELALNTPDFRMAQMIQKTINSRFPVISGPKTADGSRSSILVTVPEQYHRKYQRFIAIMLSLYLYDRPGDTDTILRRLDEKIKEPQANIEEIALAWEAVGKTALPYIRGHWQNPETEIAYYAARTALRLEDKSAIDPLILIAHNTDHPCQVAAVKDLGEYPNDPKTNAALIRLLNQRSALVRIEAYDALRKIKDPEVKVARTLRSFTIDRVATQAEPFVCIWAAGDPRIVLFGEINCPENIFSEFENGLITLNAPAGAEQITLYHQSRNGQDRLVLQCDRSLWSLLTALSFPRPREGFSGPTGLNLNFSEVVGILYQLNQQKVINVPFHLQRLFDDSY